VLIDNRTPEEIAEWIGDAERAGLTVDRSGLEASGGITGETIAAYAGSGVGRVSLGALTHSVRALDLSLHMRWE
jgi:nicotinate-nucleotide pyrophosphorylase (carboxylating)